jgi:hypothetical protein
MIKLKQPNNPSVLKRGHSHILLIVNHACDQPKAVTSINDSKQGRENAKRLNALTSHNYPRYICVSRASCYFVH